MDKFKISKLVIFGFVIIGLVVAGGLVIAGATAANSCRYDKETGNYLYDGDKVAAYGTMDSALECALVGMLPEVVADRLGMVGDEETQIEATKIYYTDKMKKEEAAKK